MPRDTLVKDKHGNNLCWWEQEKKKKKKREGDVAGNAIGLYTRSQKRQSL